jgi:SAM-dependent methyltransferase
LRLVKNSKKRLRPSRSSVPICPPPKGGGLFARLHVIAEPTAVRSYQDRAWEDVESKSIRHRCIAKPVTRGSGRWNWDEAWRSGTPAPELVRGGKRMAVRVIRFANSRKIPVRSFADFGCGPAITLFEVAAARPTWDCWGFDSSPPILRRNRSKARRERRRNVHFQSARLPKVPRREFDVVLCIATLHYLDRPLEAIRNLYALVNVGGFLMFNYANRDTRHWYQDWTRGDPQLQARFSRLLAGGNVISQEAIGAKLGRRPANFWAAVGERSPRKNPCVVVEKR